jgi:HK97 family phage major capsid protein/HK97 family phage prohead protease
MAKKPTKPAEKQEQKPAEAMETLKLPPLSRDVPIEAVSVRAEEGVTRLSFPASSETPVERWFGDEILSHDPKAVRLDRAKRGAMPLLFNHDWNDPVGIIDKARIEDSRLMVDAHLFDTARAKDVATMLSGGLRNVSIGYRIHIVEEDKKTGIFTARDWEPFEVSIVTVPADPTVGIGRQLGEELEVRMLVRQPAASAASMEKAMSGKEASAAAGENADKQERVEVIEDTTESPIEREKQRAQAIRSMAESMQINDQRTVQGWIMGGRPLEVVANEMVKLRAERSKQAAIDVAGIGLTDSEARRFSFVRAINAVFTRDWTKAGFEAEVSKATAQRMGKVMNELTFAVPPEVQYLAGDKRVLIAATAAQGGNLVQTDLMSFIDILRVRSVALRAGVTTMGGLVGQVAIPKKTTAGSVGFIAEAGTATASELVLSQLTLSPKTLAGYEEYSKQLLLQSTPDVETLVRQDLADGIAVKIDNAILWGTGANNPTGIRYTSGIGTANPTAGTAVVYADALRFQSTVAAANAGGPDAFTYLATPAVAALLMGKPRFASQGDTPIWQGNMWEGQIAMTRALSSNQIGSACMLAGDFTQAVLAQWAGLEVEVNPYANFQAGIIGVKATMFADVGVRQAGAFAIGTGMTG